MPVRPLRPRHPRPEAAILLPRLIAEWRSPDPAAHQPVILEEPARHNQPMHVYVIWDDWADLNGVERSEIIMDAYEAVHGLKQAVNVTVAMGLTAAEADRMGIAYR